MTCDILCLRYGCARRGCYVDSLKSDTALPLRMIWTFSGRFMPIGYWALQTRTERADDDGDIHSPLRSFAESIFIVSSNP